MPVSVAGSLSLLTSSSRTPALLAMEEVTTRFMRNYFVTSGGNTINNSMSAYSYFQGTFEPSGPLLRKLSISRPHPWAQFPPPPPAAGGGAVPQILG